MLGVGSDIGGSVRAPAAFSGIYTLKASIGRVPVVGMEWWLHPGFETIQGVIGPMAIGADGLELFYEVKEYCPAGHILYADMVIYRSRLPTTLGS